MSTGNTLPHLDPRYFPPLRDRGELRYTVVAVLREALAPVTLRTDEYIMSQWLPVSRANPDPVERAVMTGRKQVAPEKAAARALLRRERVVSFEERPEKGRMDTGSDGLPLCEAGVAQCLRCATCVTYGGSDAGGGGYKSRVILTDAYTVRPIWQLYEERSANVLYEDGTTNKHGKTSEKLFKHRILRPGTMFLSFMIFCDMPLEIVQFGLYNLATTSRYGASPTRQGEMANHVIGILQCNTTQPFSNQRWVERVTDRLIADGHLSPTFYRPLVVDPDKTPDPDEQQALRSRWWLSAIALRAAAVATLQDVVDRPPPATTIDRAVLDAGQIDEILDTLPRGERVKPWVDQLMGYSAAYFQQNMAKARKKDKATDGDGE